MSVRIDHGDWLDLAPSLDQASIDFLYADPPFNTGKARRTPPNAARSGRDADTQYADRFESSADYIRFLRERLASTLPALRPTANIAIHVDWRTSHHVRLLLDDLLGPDRFVNHLIWTYGLGGSSPRCFARKHDDIIVYCLDPRRAYFLAPRVPATSRRLAGTTKKATDVLDIPALNNMARERTGYPTQKPLALLELLIDAFCPPGGAVVDPVMGSGTTLVAAQRLGRHAVGFDTNARAITIARGRLFPVAAATPRRQRPESAGD
ncbi:MAG: DNA-methyltransferase [Phycisphaerales bacterium]